MIKTMKTLLATILFYIGYIYSKFPDCLFSYTVYNWCMMTSAELDKDTGKVWKNK